MGQIIRLDIFRIIGVVALLLLLAFLFQGNRGIWQPDEGYYVGTALTMVDKHNYLVPYLGEDEIFLDKPPLLYWGIIGPMQLFGHTEFAVRFFSGLCYLFTCFLVGILSFSMFSNKRLAFMSSIIYGTMIVPFIAANFVTPDTPLTFWIVLAALVFWKSTNSNDHRSAIWKVLFFVVLGFGFLTKGPAVIIPCIGMLAYLVIRRQLKSFINDIWIIVGIVLFAIIGLAWYFWIGYHLPGSISYFVDNQIWGRLISHKYKRNPGVDGSFIYLLVLTLGSLPWCVLWALKPARKKWAEFIQNRSWVRLSEEPQKLFLITWFFISLMILCLASSKLGFYALPLFIPLAIVSAKLWCDRIDSLTANFGYNSVLFSSIRFVLIWCILLLTARYALAVYPSEKDSRALWQEISKYMPKGPVEVVTVDQRADGLIFYGVKEIEHTTSKENPYPSYCKTERFLDEIVENKNESRNESMLLITNNSETTMKICKGLSAAGIHYSKFKLSSPRWLLALAPTK